MVAMADKIRILLAAGVDSTSCSQMRMTVQPAASSILDWRRSRLRLLVIFTDQNLVFVFGFTPCTGHPCQKQPSTNMATRRLVKAMSTRMPSTR